MHNGQVEDRKSAAALLVLRLTLGGFLLVWGLEKFILPQSTAGIFANFHGVPLASWLIPVLGVGQCLLAASLLAGFRRTLSYGLATLLHTGTVVATWQHIIDPWGLISGDAQHLFLAAVPVWGGFVALFLMRDRDVWTVDRYLEGTLRGSRAPAPASQQP